MDAWSGYFTINGIKNGYAFRDVKRGYYKQKKFYENDDIKEFKYLFFVDDKIEGFCIKFSAHCNDLSCLCCLGKKTK